MDPIDLTQMSYEHRNVVQTLQRMAGYLRTDADGCDRLARQIAEFATANPDSTPSDYGPAVLGQVFRALNNSSLVGPAEMLASAVTR